ncbi:MAG: 3-(3-hydroxy-phenyl)propionate hydroxylase [Saliniramus fredricksonii]|uniref:3-(3-hydroxy-phenyl)propionate hydroxylase n=1 Tax=Saliniramus fredricksonii TaxID=1653334 RepID=A0A0P7XAT8_9HYPH|nr:FAD-dependent oxidoreductase [Saliniramus fredricksonii]KPQ12391.1 MAG: 3-(3-hydroxy-phenyl)propionate hydroxylase [Saliniramus fredricksonii]SCC81293.1 3-(3-hydroxy-phenyl)propionate hydroxylase [Saliniramus fredricksonii]
MGTAQGVTTGGERKSLYQFSYRRSPDQDGAPAQHPVVVIGAGPVGLACAIDMAQRGVPVVLLDDADRIGEGSRGICYAKRTLEILDRLGLGETCRDQGVTWQLGRVFQGDGEVYNFDLLPENGHKMPAFVNLQQYYLEHHLVTRAQTLADGDGAAIDLRWRNRVIGIAQEGATDGAGVTLTIETPDGAYDLQADWVVAADGARSPCRDLMGLAFEGEVFEERFLIADVKMKGEFPAERWFWFDPPFHEGRSALLHKQPDDVWRIDLGLGAQADATEEQKPERVIPRIRQMLGHGDFSLEWVSVYTFQCRRLARFVHDRVIFAGDAAHQVSPFGARGANSGIQDAENLAWKLAAVIRGDADARLLASYDTERIAAADENIGHSTRSTDFIAPRTAQEMRFRDAALALAAKAGFARRMVNSGRLSMPTTYRDSPLSTPDAQSWGGSAALGAPAPDAPMRTPDGTICWLLEALDGACTLLHMPGDGASVPRHAQARTLVIGRDLIDADGSFTRRFDASPGATWLIRPDQHLAARWRRATDDTVERAIERIFGRG